MYFPKYPFRVAFIGDIARKALCSYKLHLSGFLTSWVGLRFAVVSSVCVI